MPEPAPDWAAWREAALACLADAPAELAHDPFRPAPLAVGALLRELRVEGVQWILNGSVVFVAAGGDITPGDLDVVPALDDDNLERMARVLERMAAFPEPDLAWEHGLDLDEVRRWRPRPAVEANLNHRFVTAHGILDVVPRLTGTYPVLATTARPVTIEGEEVLAVPIGPLLKRLRESGRRKDRQRWDRLAPLADR